MSSIEPIQPGGVNDLGGGITNPLGPDDFTGGTPAITATASAVPSFQTVLEIDFPSGTRCYSYRGVRSATAIYRALITEANAITRGISVVPSRYRASELNFGLWDRANEFSTLKATDSFYDCPVRVLRSQTGGSLELIASGRLSDWNVNENICNLMARDPIFDRLENTIDSTLVVLDPQVFPGMPSTQKPLLVPLPYGRNELDPISIAKESGPGVCPAYLIDAANTQSKWWYVVAQAEIDSVLRVFNYETLLSETLYRVFTAVYGGQTMTLLEFNGDVRDPQRARDLEITCDVIGVVDEAGNVIENPIEQARHFFVTYCPDVTSADLETGEWDAQSAKANGRHYLSAFNLLDREWTYLDVFDHFNQSFLMPLYPTPAGTITTYLVTEEIGTPVATFSEARNLLADSFIARGIDRDQIATRIRYSYFYHWGRGFFRNQENIFIKGEQDRIGREIIKDLELPFVRDRATARKIVKAYAPFFREAAAYVECEVEPARLADAGLNMWVGITHRHGIASDGLGYRNQPMRVIQSDYMPTPDEAHVSIHGIVTPTATFDTTPWQEIGFWLMGETEDRTKIAVLLPAPTEGWTRNNVAWSLITRGESEGGMSRLSWAA